MEKFYLAGLRMIPGIGNILLRKIVEYYGSAEQAWRSNSRELHEHGILDERVSNNLVVYREKISIHKLAQQLQNKNIQICTFGDPEYPVLLRTIFDPPVILFYPRG